jgi:hypothetical protein
MVVVVEDVAVPVVVVLGHVTSKECFVHTLSESVPDACTSINPLRELFAIP